VLSKRAAFAGWESNRGFLKNQFKPLIERGVPVEGLRALLGIALFP
jgi:hypothetical protein